MERKLATVLFVDLVDSTRLVVSSDPEVVRRRVNSFFETVSDCIRQHGGIVEKFAGDAVHAAFGAIQTHEDDAHRAARAALAMREAVVALGLEARIGIEAGELVFESADASFGTGEAINLAARLQQSARPGEILVGPTAHRLAGGSIVVEDAGPLELKGFEAPLRAWRLVDALESPARALGTRSPLVGRDAELELLENTFTRTVRDGRAHIVTIFGEAGIGKSRLAREFVDGVERASVLSGRCLPYGEGVTYWPLGEMIKAAAGIADDDPLEEAFEKLRACCAEDAVADVLGLASGLLEALESEHGAQEISWAARDVMARLADVQPLVLVFEDIHWAEGPLLDLVEYLADGVVHEPPRLFGFQAAGAAPLVAGAPVADPQTIATAIRIGNPASWDKAVAAATESEGAIMAVTDREILAAYPETEKVFRKYYGDGCFSCPGQATESVKQSAMMHNVSERQLLSELNRAAGF